MRCAWSGRHVLGRELVAVLAVLAGLGLSAGCGGDERSDPAAEAAAYTARVQEICEGLESSLTDAIDNGQTYDDGPVRALEQRRATLDALRSEEPPPELVSAHAELVDTQQTAVDLADELIAGLYDGGSGWDRSPLSPSEAETFASLAAANRVARKLWRDVGVTDCG